MISAKRSRTGEIGYAYAVDEEMSRAHIQIREDERKGE